MSQTAAASSSQTLDPDAFKKLYPEDFYKRFIDNGIRPDGRPFGRARQTTIGPKAVGTADASALVKIGSTAVIAGLKLEVLTPTGDKFTEGQVAINVEFTALSSGSPAQDRRQFQDTASCCVSQVDSLLKSSKAVDLKKLVLASGKAAWVAYVDLYVLDADGSVLDACLLAAVSCLSSLKQLPHMLVDDNGNVVQAKQQDQPQKSQSIVDRERIPSALTMGLYGENLIVDPTAEEEELMEASVTVSVDSPGNLIGFYKPGGSRELSTSQVLDCVEAAKLRHKTVMSLLDQSLKDAVS